MIKTPHTILNRLHDFTFMNIIIYIILYKIQHWKTAGASWSTAAVMWQQLQSLWVHCALIWILCISHTVLQRLSKPNFTKFVIFLRGVSTALYTHWRWDTWPGSCYKTCKHWIVDSMMLGYRNTNCSTSENLDPPPNQILSVSLCVSQMTTDLATLRWCLGRNVAHELLFLKGVLWSFTTQFLEVNSSMECLQKQL